jgi:uncharacterized membrane protein YphA (DoxX/SURF4 family)
MNHVDAWMTGMTSWTDPHTLSALGFEGVGRCATVFWSSALLSGLVTLLVIYGLKRRRGKALLTLQLLVGAILVMSALKPLVEFFSPAWHSTNDQDVVDVLLHRTISWQVVSYYVGCCSGLGLLCYLALSKHPSARRALIWLIAPLTIGAAFTIFGPRWMTDPPDANASTFSAANAHVGYPPSLGLPFRENIP